jgi:hypothetical protein
VRALTVAVVGVLLLAGCGSDSDSDSESAGDEVSLLFVQDAEGGTIDDDVLTMVEVSPNTGWFTDRPNREAGQMATADFVSLWDEGNTFDIDPPNADFTCQADGDTVNAVVELLSPVANGPTLTYDVLRVGDTPAGDFDCDRNVHLFIDSADAGRLRPMPGGGGIIINGGGGGGGGGSSSGANCATAQGGSLDLNNAYLKGCDLNGMNLNYAALSHAFARDANLSNADLEQANLERADLTDANLSGASLSGADLTDAYMPGANLTGVLGWNSVIGKDTIGGLDKATGVPD